MANTQAKQRPKLYIIDGYSLIYRSYFAFISRPLRDKDGRNVSALFGFFNTLLMLLRQYEIDYLAVAMDTAAPTFRHLQYPQYKANREKAPEDLHSQVPLINAVLAATGIPQIGRDGWEADDVIASLASFATSNNIDTVMVTGDKDLLQLVDEHVKALRPPQRGQSEYRLVGSQEVYEEFQVTPEQIVDYLALIGDSSDNIPGVSGIGPKGAVKLLQEFFSLEEVYANIQQCSPAIAKRLEAGREAAFLSQDLITLRKDALAGEELDIEEFSLQRVNWGKAVPYFEDSQAYSLVKAISEFTLDEIVATTVEPVIESVSYQTITSITELEKKLKEETQGGYLAIDFETTSLDEMEATIVGFSFTSRAYHAYYVPLVAGGARYIESGSARELLHKYLVEAQVKLIGQNLKYDYKIMRLWSLEKLEIYFDTMIAAWLLDSSESSYSIDNLAQRFLNGYQMIRYADVVPNKGMLFSEVELDKASTYGAEDADISWRLYEEFSRQLKERNLERLFFELEMPLVKVLSEMELTGITLDSKILAQFDNEVSLRIATIEREIFQLCGREFNLNSPKQLQEVLFVERNLPPFKKTKTGFSTDTDTLEQLAHLDAVPQLILENRALVKLKSTYINSLPQMVNARTGRIHTSYLQTGTATGRLSSRNPNLQNIPVRNEDGKRIRTAFIASSGSLLLSADYSQIELVILSHVAQDEALQKAFLTGQDIHRHTAALIFGIDVTEVTAEQRRMAKTINFGVMYGMSAFRLAGELHISNREAQDFINDYFERFNGVRSFIQTIHNEAEASGKVATLFGRERLVPEIQSRNRTEKAQGERIAVNTVIQGTAADIMKMAMLNVARRMESEQLNSRLLLQVHDELIFEVPESELTQMQLLVREEMEQVVTLAVPLRTSLSVGNNWGELS